MFYFLKKKEKNYKTLKTEIHDWKPEHGIPSLYPVFATKYKDLIADAAKKTSGAFSALKTSQILSLHEQFLHTSVPDADMDWPSVDTHYLKNHMLPFEFFSVMAIGSFHANGYYRQACIQALDTYGEQSIPFLLIAMNDWVSEIRSKAYSLLQFKLLYMSLNTCMESFGYLLKLKNSTRRSQADYDKIEALFFDCLESNMEQISPEHILVLEHAPRHFAYRVLTERKLITKENCLTLLKRDHEYWSEKILLNYLFQQFKVNNVLEKELLNNRSVNIRYITLRAHHQNKQGDPLLYKRALTDSSLKIRDYARFAISSYTEFDYAEYYREIIQKACTPGAIMGLGETGDKKDIHMIKPYFTDEHLAVRKAALYSVARLNSYRDAELYLACLTNLDFGLSRVAYEIILYNKSFVSCRQYLEAYRQTNNSILKKRLIKIINFCLYWDRISVLIRLYPDAGDLQPIVLNYISRWVTTSNHFLKPNKRQLKEIKSALEISIDALPEEYLKPLKFKLGHYTSS